MTLPTVIRFAGARVASMRAILTAPCRCGRHECGSRIKELAEALKLTAGRDVQLVDELEADGTASRSTAG